VLFETLCLPWEGIPLVLTVIKQEQKFKKPTNPPSIQFGILPKRPVRPKSVFSLLPLTSENCLAHVGVSQQHQEQRLSELRYCLPIRRQADCHHNTVSTCNLMK